MEGRNTPAKVCAVLGTVLVWSPILLTFATSVIGSLSSGRFLFDYLMPAELFPAALIGAFLLLWAAFRAHAYLRQTAVGLGAAVLFLFGGQAIAVAGGLASGATPPEGWIWVLVIASLVIYTLAVVELGVVGVRLAMKLLRSKR